MVVPQEETKFPNIKKHHDITNLRKTRRRERNVERDVERDPNVERDVERDPNVERDVERDPNVERDPRRQCESGLHHVITNLLKRREKNKLKRNLTDEELD